MNNYTIIIIHYIIVHSKDKRVEFQTSSQLKCLHNDKYKMTWLKQKGQIKRYKHKLQLISINLLDDIPCNIQYTQGKIFTNMKFTNDVLATAYIHSQFHTANPTIL